MIILCWIIGNGNFLIQYFFPNFKGEEAVFDVLKQHERNPSKAFDSILKVIRAQIEEKKSEKEQNMTGSQSMSYDGKYDQNSYHEP